MPEQTKVQAFIEAYSLFADWGIIASDVIQDIRTLIIQPKVYSSSSKKKQISSYKQYLEKLYDAFGIPECIPDCSDISEFIDEYELSRVWGITVEDVTKDLQSFINGEYEEMYRESARVGKPVNLAVPKPSSITSHTYLPKPKMLTPSVSSSVIPKSGKSSSVKPTVKKQTQAKAKKELEETIFIDGDNHLNEGQKGIEQLSKKTRVRAIFSQKGAKRKFDKKYGNRPNVSSKLVDPGDQAVDNQIKAEAGQLLKKGNQDITFVSQDKDFADYRDRKKCGKDGNRIRVSKSVKERNSRKNKK